MKLNVMLSFSHTQESNLKKEMLLQDQLLNLNNIKQIQHLNTTTLPNTHQSPTQHHPLSHPPRPPRPHSTNSLSSLSKSMANSANSIHSQFSPVSSKLPPPLQPIVVSTATTTISSNSCQAPLQELSDLILTSPQVTAAVSPADPFITDFHSRQESADSGLGLGSNYPQTHTPDEFLAAMEDVEITSPDGKVPMNLLTAMEDVEITSDGKIVDVVYIN